ncbi:Uncharacterised protein g9828 [Pycnogonum litorale]
MQFVQKKMIMAHNMFILIVFVCIIAVNTVEGTCGGTLSKPAGKITSNNSVETGCVCNWNFSIPENITQGHIFFNFLKLDLSDNDVVSVTEGNETKTLFTGNPDSYSYITSGVRPKLTLKCSNSAKDRKFDILYNSEKCLVNINEKDGLFKAPVAAKGVDNMDCVFENTYKDSVQYISFAKFDLGEGVMELHDGTSESARTIRTFSGSQKYIPDTITISPSILLKVTLKYKQSKMPIFEGYFTSLSKDCNKMFQISDAGQFNLTSLNYPKPYPIRELDCRWIISTTTKSSKFSAKFKTLQLALGLDMVEIRDGARKDGKLLALITNSTFSKGKKIIGSNNNMWVRFSKDSGSSAGGFFAVVSNVKIGGYYTNNGSIVIPATSDMSSKVFTFLIDVGNNKQAELNVVESGTELYPDSELWLYDGFDQSSSTLLDVLVSNREFYNVVSTGNRLMVLAKKFGPANKFQAKYSGIRYGYHYVSAGKVDAKTIDSSYMGNLMWVIRPQRPINMDDRLISISITDLNLHGADFVKISKLSSTTSPLLFFNSSYHRPATLYVSIESGVKIEINRSYRFPLSNVTVFTASYQVIPVCTQTYDLASVKTLLISSPAYPNQYPLYANCKWVLKLPSDANAHLSFHDVDLERNHTILISSANKTIVSKISGKMLPDDLLISGTKQVTIEFISPVFNSRALTAKGFSLMATFAACGGLKTDETGVMATPDYPKQIKNVFCIWLVTVPWIGKQGHDYHQFISFATTTTPVNTSSLVFALYDGGSVWDHFVENVTSSGKTRKNKMVVVYHNHNILSDGVSIKYQASSCPKSKQCDDGICIHDGWYCDGIAQCVDYTDEKNCDAKPQEKKTVITGIPTWALGFSIVIFLAFGIFIGFCAPVVYRKYKANDMYSSFSNIPVVTE